MCTVLNYNKENVVPSYLLIKYYNKCGRNFGTITSRHKEKSKISKLFKNLENNYFNYSKNSNMALVLSNFINSNKNCIYSLIMYITGIFKGKKRIIINTKNILTGDLLNYNINVSCKLGSSRPLKLFPIGSFIYCVEGTPKHGSEIAKSGGTFTKIIFHKDNYVYIKLPSGYFKKLNNNCMGIFGICNNSFKCKIKKAGYSRLIGIRPKVRGVAMNSIDHPHGGGKGKSSVGLKTIKTPWGKYGYGVSTRHKSKIKANFTFKYLN